MSVLPEPRTLIDELLEEQSRLTAVDRFSRRHSESSFPAQSRYYEALLPASPPGPGEQYAFAVDLDVCTGCKACVSACHSLNGLDEEETWRDVGALVGGSAAAPYQQTVTTACHHCVEPACAEGCPVLAYEKDEITGIVRHLDDQCIGCQYCMLKCPYDVPKYSETRGIVRKCDMCHSRLAVGEAPACVQACPNGAISISVVRKSDIASRSSAVHRLLPGAFESSYTQPSTSYSTRRQLPANARPANAGTQRLEHAHWPLIFMLLLTQVATGVFVTTAGLALTAGSTFDLAFPTLAGAGFALLHAGLGVSVLHLGRPLGAWRAFLGLRRSWMSREIVVFGGLSAVSGALVAAALGPWLSSALPISPLIASVLTWSYAAPGTALATAFTGLLGIACSAMIYIDTRRPFWQASITFPKFFGTTLLLGTAGSAALLGWLAVWVHSPAVGSTAFLLAMAATVIRTVLFGWESSCFISALRDPEADFHRSATIMWSLRRKLVLLRPLLFLGSTFTGLLAMATSGTAAAALATISFGLTFGSQVIERYFYFTAVDAPRMPGNLTR